MRPHEIVGVIRDPVKRQGHQRRFAQIKALLAGGGHLRLQALRLLFGRQTPPVLLHQGQIDLAQHHLHGLLHILPHIGRAQDGVALNDLPPG